MSAVKTYTCGWCLHQHLPLADDGMLMPHRIMAGAGKNQPWCDGLKTYRAIPSEDRGRRVS